MKVKGWRTHRVDEIFEVQLGKMLNEAAKSGESPAPYLTNFNVQWGQFKLDSLNQMSFSPREREKFALRKGDLIMCEGGEVGRCAIWKDEVTPCFYQKALHRLRPKDGRIVPEFMLAYMRFIAGTKRLSDLTSQSSIAHLTLEKLVELEVPCPPLPEQRKISGVLGTWDEALEKLDALIAAKERRKQALMQQLLTGRKRLNGFGSKWSTVTLGELIRPNIRPVAKPTAPFLSAGIRSHNRGVFLKPDFKPADIALDELFELKAGELVANITFAWEGALAIVPPEADGALVSHRFPTFEFLPARAAVGFLRHLIQTSRFVFRCGLASPGGAGRNRVLSKTEFLKIPVSAPSIEEQTAIGEILDAYDEELRLLRNQRDALDRQKRGLIQRLLTGKLRVETKSLP